MRWPSVTGVEVAGLLVAWTVSIVAVGAACRQTILPVARSRAISSTLLAVLSKAVTKMRSFQMQGEPWPAGSGVFQTSALAGPNSAGGLASAAATPAPPGPRNGGQTAGPASYAKAHNAHSARLRREKIDMTHPSFGC